MAKREKGGYREPTEREVEGIRQLIAMVEQIQQLAQQQTPEGFARMMEQAQQQDKE